MNIRERALSVYRGEEPDRVPWLIYENLCPRGSVDRKLRNRGMGLIVSSSVFREETPHVRVETKASGNIVERTYHTPAGDLSTKERVGLPEGEGSSWTMEYLVKQASDFAAAEFIVEDTVIVPDYEPFVNAERNLGSDGIVITWAGRSPLQRAQLSFLGYKTFAIAMYRYPKELDHFLRVLGREMDERYRVIAESPAEIVNGTDNVNSEIVNSKLYEKYIIPFYERQSRVLHRHGKILEDHLDGKLARLKDLVAKTDIDVVGAFTPPPMGDLPLAEARSAWKGKVISLNFPESVFLEGNAATRGYAENLLREAAPGDGFMVTVTEDIPARFRWTGLSVVTGVLQKYGKYPLRF